MKRTAYLATAASVVLMFGGPVAAAAAATADTARTVPAAATARADVTAGAAMAAALKAHPGVVQSVDRDGSVWHVDVISKDGKHAELEVDAATGSVTKENQDDNDDDDGSENAALLAAKVKAEQAVKTALAAHSGQVWSVNWDDDDDNGKTYWNVEVKTTGGKTQNVHVDPATGKVTASTTDSDTDDNDNS
ncbi:PepSY domain-containing protein [Streptomyces sp. NPDC058613]|uniref:PepSY domain-containing protein n=1 Tax=Streptomyces sp. NPDC058613 TaxID=3346556 RepID=UPI00365527A7